MIRDNFFKKAAFMKNKTIFLGMITIFIISFAYFAFAGFTQGVLISPANDSWDTDGNVNFSCSFNVTGQNDTIMNVSLYTNISGSLEINMTNSTQLTPAGNYTYYFNPTTIPDGHYLWNCLASDNGTEEFWAGMSDYTIKVDATEPTVTVTLSDPTPTKAGNVTFTLDFNEVMNQTQSPTLKLNDSSVTEIGWQSSTQWTGWYNFTTETEGNYTINVTAAKDVAGNTMAEDTSNWFVLDTTAPQYSNVGKNDTNIKINDVVEFSTQWLDSTSGLDYYIFSWNHSGSWDNESAVVLTDWSNVTMEVNATHKPEINWMFYANDTAGNWNNTGIQTFTVNNTALEIAANATSPANVYTNTDWQVNLTVTDADSADTLTGYVQFYINGVSSGSEQSLVVSNGTNKNVANLSSSSFNKSETLTAEYWAGDGTANTTKLNMSGIVLNSAPNVVVDGTLTNATGHWFSITARVQDVDGGSDITATNITPSSGTCVHLTNTTDGASYFNVTYNCSGTALVSTTVAIGFTDAGSAYVQTSDVSNVYPNFNPSTPTLTNPGDASYTTTLPINMTWSLSTDNDGDNVNYHVLVNGVEVCYTTDLNCTYSPAEETYVWNVTPYDGAANGTISASRTYTYDITEPTPSNTGKNDSNIKVNDVVEFYTLWTDSTAGLSHYIFSWNQSGWGNDSAVAVSGSANWTNITKTVTAVKDSIVGWMIYVNDSAGNMNDTGIQTFTVNNTAPTVAANVTSPSPVFTNTNFMLNLTIVDVDLSDTITGYVQFYVNDAASGSVQSQQPVSSGINTLIATLGSGNFSKSDNLTAEHWAGDGTVNISKYNITVTVSSATPTIHVQNTFTNCSIGHCFNVTAGIMDIDGGSDIVATNISTSIGPCTHLTNTTSGDYFNVTFNCSHTLLASSSIMIGFTDAGSNYAQTNPSTNTYPNQLPPQPTLTNPAHGYASNVTENVTMNWTASTDADGDTVNYYVTVNGTQACDTPDLNCTYETSAVQDYVWNVTPYDSSQNGTTSTSRTFSYDLTKPILTEVSRSSVTSSSATLTATTDENATCAYSTTDTSYSSMTTFSTTGTTSHSKSLTSLSASTSYTYYVRCKDIAGNIMNFSNSTTFTTTAATTTPGGGSSSGGSVSRTSISEQGTSVTLRKGFVKTFMLSGKYHTMKGVEIGTDYITFQIASTPVTVTLNLLESKSFDFDNDGYYDLYVKLDEIKSSTAYMTLKQIHESVTAEAEEQPEETPEEVPEETPEEVPEETPEEVPDEVPPEEVPPANPKTAMIIVLVIALLALIGLLIYRKKKGY